MSTKSKNGIKKLVAERVRELTLGGTLPPAFVNFLADQLAGRVGASLEELDRDFEAKRQEILAAAVREAVTVESVDQALEVIAFGDQAGDERPAKALAQNG